ncbi:jg22811 [Pararge aegeria aegeria]|uniref:Jg22811 protein n=1 Tax=Pararge aegeria aegeria TaxID=348720 RepID=A0A8S4RVD0_9NEOP|nr:jg22811 [Pararge aegeria aegeria]
MWYLSQRGEARVWLQYPASRLQRLLRSACPPPRARRYGECPLLFTLVLYDPPRPVLLMTKVKIYYNFRRSKPLTAILPAVSASKLRSFPEQVSARGRARGLDDILPPSG